MNVDNEDKITEFFNKVVVGMPTNVKEEAEKEAERIRGQVLAQNGALLTDVDAVVK